MAENELLESNPVESVFEEPVTDFQHIIKLKENDRLLVYPDSHE